ncbi:hypothetical protein PM082_000946 [Marasmius tenuissimus]|nr:hypothetical protein PM082_000946 [Marasmius tenuissimus]
MSVVSPQPQDPFQLERLAEELATREVTSSREYDENAAHDLPEYVPLSHDNSYLTAETFDVEDFLLSRSHTSLQDLKVELRDYLSNLKEELVQLINDDYEAFISLSTDLKGEGTRLNNLKAPLAGLKQEIQISKSELYAIQDTIQEKLKKRAALREEKVLQSAIRQNKPPSINFNSKGLAPFAPEDIGVRDALGESTSHIHQRESRNG